MCPCGGLLEECVCGGHCCPDCGCSNPDPYDEYDVWDEECTAPPIEDVEVVGGVL